MIQKSLKIIFLGILCIIIGMFLGFYFEVFIKDTIQDIFRLSTSNRIQITGKRIYIFSDISFRYFLGLGILIVVFANLNLRFLTILKNIIICLTIFGISIFVISTIDASIKIIECTACNNGIRALHWNKINYNFIIGISTFISVMPSLIRIKKRVLKEYS